MMKFFYSPQSSATRVHVALEELGVPYEKVRVSLDKGDQKKPEFLAINPNGKVPALVDGDAKLFESLAIITYLGEKYGVEKGLWPKLGTPEHAQALSWTFWMANEPQPALFDVVLHACDFHWAHPKEHRSEYVAGKGREAWSRTMAILDKHLEGKDYMLGKQFSLVDTAVCSGVAFGKMAANLPVDGKNLGAWFGRCASRPALQRVMSEQG